MDIDELSQSILKKVTECEGHNLYQPLISTEFNIFFAWTGGGTRNAIPGQIRNLSIF